MLVCNEPHLIHEYSGGMARKVNNVCVACLLDAFTGRKALIDDRMAFLSIRAEVE